MSGWRKSMVALAAVALLAAGTWLLWPRDVYRYQGKTVEEWFGTYVEDSPDERGQVITAFRAMGTNAASFLASRINQEPDPSLLEGLTRKLPTRRQQSTRYVVGSWFGRRFAEVC